MPFDFFLAHSASDQLAAEVLYELLTARGANVFLDSKSLAPGELWDRRLAEAQRDARITVLLLSAATENSYYESEEVATAIALSRAPGQSHRVVPIYLSYGLEPPYGLRRVHSLTAIGHRGLIGAAEELLELSQHAESPPRSPAPDRDKPHISHIPQAELGNSLQRGGARGREFLFVRTEEDLKRASKAAPVLLITGQAERGPGEANAIARVRREVYPSIEATCEKNGMTVAWANIAGLFRGFKRDPINDYLTHQGIRYAGVHLFQDGQLIKTERVARITAGSQALVAAALRLLGESAT